MLISKFDLYKSEWLELVFDNRNKTYGAYELRQHNGRTLATAMAIAFTAITVAAIGIGILIKPVAIAGGEHLTTTVVRLQHYVFPPTPKPPQPLTAHRTPTPAIAPATPNTMHRFVPLVTAPDPIAAEPPTAISMTAGTIGPANIKGTGKDAPVDPGPTDGPPATGNGTEVHTTIGLERMPEPVGGAGAWGKFLNKNLKYPDMAIDQHMSGKVWVSFIVEKDGHLSNIVVDRGSGYGMDEEALRVLKLAPAWRPGIQNGQPVRVKYNIPINFQLGDE